MRQERFIVQSQQGSDYRSRETVRQGKPGNTEAGMGLTFGDD
jgi:hypothetical protein